MKRCTYLGLTALVALCCALALVGCADKTPKAPASPAAPKPAIEFRSSETSSPSAVVKAFFEAANAGDGDAMNMLFGTGMQLFSDMSPAPRAYREVVIGAATDSDGPLETVDTSRVRGPSKGPQPVRIIRVPVELKVSGESPYLPVDEGPAKLSFTLVTDDGDSWRIYSVRNEP